MGKPCIIAALLLAAATDAAYAAPTVSDRIVERFMALDEDESGTVSIDEYLAMVVERAEQRFNAMDSNHDEEITPEERADYWRKQQAKWYRLNR